jgi:hypothetical protein
MSTAPADRREVELLLCCARTQLEPEMADRIKSLAQQGIDWTYLVELARSNGVTPLLYRSLTATCADAVPEAILKDLTAHYRRNAIRSLLLTAELLRLLELFDAHGIQAPSKAPRSPPPPTETWRSANSATWTSWSARGISGEPGIYWSSRGTSRTAGISSVEIVG